MTGLSLSDADRLALAAAGVAESPDGSLRSASGAIVSPGVAAALISRGDSLGKAQAQPAMSGIDPGQFQRGYLTAGHAADSPANAGGLTPVPPPDHAAGGRCTTPDDDGPGDGDGMAKVVTAEDFARGPLIAGHALPSPGDAGDNNSVTAVTGSGHETYAAAAGVYNANVQQARAEHVMPSQACPSRPAPAQWSPPADLGACNVPQPRAAGATQKAPGE